MGDIADMMMEGILCQICGEYLDDGAPGYPRYCDACEPDGVKRIRKQMDRIKSAIEDRRKGER